MQGGGCVSVGAAGGFLQGGGFGSHSKKYGIAAASLLEAEIVTADGQTRIANACQNPDLYWALRGGGGGTFGVVTRVVLRTYDLPKSVGGVFGTIKAKDDAAYRALLERFVAFYGEKMSNEHWGEKVVIGPDDAMEVSLVFQGLTKPEVDALWEPFRAALDPKRYTVELRVVVWPPEKSWDVRFFQAVAPEAVSVGTNGWWWKGDGEQVGVTWAAYQSRWIPEKLFHGKRLGQVFFDASRHWPFELHFNKGQANASSEAQARDRETAMSPAVLDAAALAISGSWDKKDPEGSHARVTAAMKVLRTVTPESGSYVNETDYFEPDWQHAFWGANYSRLLEVKRKYDPDGVFVCHHCVGSE